MAKIIINKGFISHGGRLYKAGEVVDIADSGYARRIVERSGGDFAFYHGQGIPAADEGEGAAATDGANLVEGGEEEDGAETGGVSESDNGSGAGLPAIDANADMQTARTAKGKKK